MLDYLSQPMPWYVAGPLIGLTLPLLLIVGNKTFGISSSFQHMCAAVLPKKFPYFDYDWKTKGKWHLQLSLGIILGGVLASFFTPKGYTIQLAESTVTHLRELGITNFSGYVPAELFNWEVLGTAPGLIMLVLGGLLIGFGTRYASGCTSGHAITGLATLQKASLIAVIGFFIGGIISTYFLLPIILN
ncbi:MAG: YeeE/YedE family protein [Balneolaceae bacterium]|nr:YeeE/YedE family protein [Balneolaceae bacterium]